MLKLVPPQELNLEEMAVAVSIILIICVPISLKMAQWIKSAVPMAPSLRVQRRFRGCLARH